MEILNIKSTLKTPTVTFDNEGLLYIGGRSIHEHPEKFYGEIIDVIDKVKENCKLQITLDYEYFNTGAAKQILKLLRKADGFSASVVWKYEEGDDDMEHAGIDYQDIMKNMHFVLIEKEE